ncbi:hypothetical protein VQ042_21465 [Aurantimonas sp. A2-1-M11]
MTDTTSTSPKKSPRTGTETAAPTKRALRLQRQAEYQRAYRADQKRKRIPSRDDAARVALHWLITDLIAKDNQTKLVDFHHGIVRRLVKLGFDRDGAERRVSDLTDRYEDGWTFQSKPHLRRQPEPGSMS